MVWDSDDVRTRRDSRRVAWRTEGRRETPNRNELKALFGELVITGRRGQPGLAAIHLPMCQTGHLIHSWRSAAIGSNLDALRAGK
jgi:hypothetical protein